MAGRRYALKHGEGAAEGMRRVIAGRLEKAAERLRENGADGDLAAAVLGARKDLKKARAALRTVRADLGAGEFKREDQHLRDAARLLAESRAAEVRLATLDELVESAEGTPPPGPLRTWRDALVAERERIVGAGADAAAGARLDDQMALATWEIEAGLAAVPALNLEHDGWRLLGPGVVRAYREGRAGLVATAGAPSAAAVHDWRKRAKDLWYQLRLLEAAWPEVLEATAAELHRLTELLGDHHDLAVLAEDLGSRGDVDAGPVAAFTELIERRQAALLAEALELGTRLYAEKPNAFGRRLRAYWRAWRHPD